MKIAARRRLAVGVLATTSALIAGTLIAPSAQAAALRPTTDTDRATSNAVTAPVTLSFTTTTPFPRGGDPEGAGTQIEMTRTGTTDDTIIGDVVEEPVPPVGTTIKGSFVFGQSGTRAPANPGRYDVFIYVGDRATGDSCTGCFTVFSGPPTVTAATPASLPTGVQGQTFAVTGTNFAKSTTVEALFPGTQTVDPSIRFTAARAGSPAADVPNTSTRLPRTIRVDPAAAVGLRDLRVTNTDATQAVLSNGLRITSAFITGIEPNASGNTGVESRKISGRGFVQGSVPALVNETTGASIVGTDVVQTTTQSISANFNTAGASPGVYRVQLTAPDGTVTTPECSPTYTIVNTSGSGTGTAALKPSDFSCAQAAALSPSPSTSSSASGSASPTASSSTSPSASSSASSTASSTASSSASPTATAGARADARYAGLSSPLRVLDTRANRGARVRGEQVLDLSQQVTDANATSAVLNVTVTNPTARGFLVAYPNGNTKPGTSNVNFDANQTQANEVVVGLSPNRRVSLFVDSASAHVIVDLVGFFTTTNSASTGRVTTGTPQRALDSRSTDQPRRTGEVVVNLGNLLPSGATDAILNVTVQGPGARGYVVAYPTGTSRPPTSNVNFERGQTQANEVLTRVGTGSNAGRVSLFIDFGRATSATALIVDVVGAVTPGSTAGSQVYTSLQQPARALDTRSNRGARRSGAFDAQMPSAVPNEATGVVLNVTSTNGTRSGFIAVYPAGTANPGTSNVNFPGERQATRTTPASAGTQANEVISRLGNNRSVTLFVGGRDGVSSHVLVDVVGYLTGTGAPAATSSSSASGSARPSGSASPSATASCTPGPPLIGPTCPSPSASGSASPSASGSASPRPSSSTSTSASPTGSPRPSTSTSGSTSPRPSGSSSSTAACDPISEALGLCP